jgi:flagellar FliL protein
MSDAPAAAAAPAKGGKKKLIIIAAAVLVLGGGAAGAAFYFKSAPADDHAKAEPPASERGLISFDPFIVNLADPVGGRFLKATVQLIVASAAQAKEVEETPVMLMQARSAILDVLSQQTAEHLVSPEGKTAVRTTIRERIAANVHELEVLDVLFSDFVVQF